MLLRTMVLTEPILTIDGVRLEVPSTEDCFLSLLNGEAILPNIASAPPLPPEPEDMPAAPPKETPAE